MRVEEQYTLGAICRVCGVELSYVLDMENKTPEDEAKAVAEMLRNHIQAHKKETV